MLLKKTSEYGMAKAATYGKMFATFPTSLNQADVVSLLIENKSFGEHVSLCN